MTNRTVNLWIDVVFFFVLHRVPIRRGLPSEIRHFFNRAQMRFRISVASDAPRHRKFFVLKHDFHLIDAAVTAFATDTRIDVCGVIEKHELGQIVDSLPSHALARFPTFMNRSQLFAGRLHRSERRHALIVRWTMTIDAGRRRWNRGMSGIEDGVVTVATIHSQLTRVNRVAKRYRLFRFVADIQRFGIRHQAAHRKRIDASARRSSTKNQEKRINPTRKKKPLHDGRPWPWKLCQNVVTDGRSRSSALLRIERESSIASVLAREQGHALVSDIVPQRCRPIGKLGVTTIAHLA